jgi:hypothetical protein
MNEIEDSYATLEMDPGPISTHKIEDALNSMKKGKVPGEDKISTDMLKTNTELTAQILGPT